MSTASENWNKYQNNYKKIERRKINERLAAGDAETIAKEEKRREYNRNKQREYRAEKKARADAGDPEAIASLEKERARERKRSRENYKKENEKIKNGDSDAIATRKAKNNKQKPYIAKSLIKSFSDPKELSKLTQLIATHPKQAKGKKNRPRKAVREDDGRISFNAPNKSNIDEYKAYVLDTGEIILIPKK